MFQKTMLYLGLAPEDEYDDLEQIDPYEERRAAPAPAGHAAPPAPTPAAPAAARPQNGAPVNGGTEVEAGAVRTISREQAVAAGARVSSSSPSSLPHSSSVRTFAMSSAKPHVIAPRQFNEAQVVADRFKAEQPVILNLQEVDRDLRRRLIDFASGLSYGLGGRMDRVADGVYMLTPDNVEVSDEERRRLQERGLHH